MVQESSPKCVVCKKPTTHGIIQFNGRGLTCYECAEKQKAEKYRYSGHGMTDGTVENIPRARCAVCGGSIEQPLPTGLWLHSSYEDFKDREDHTPIIATQLQELLQFNNQTWIGDSHYVKECFIHRKYWLKEAKLSKTDEDNMLRKPTNWDLEHFAKNDSIRENSMAFIGFLNGQNKKLNKNPDMPKKFLRISTTKGRGFGKLRNETLVDIEYKDEFFVDVNRWYQTVFKYKSKLMKLSIDPAWVKISGRRTEFQLHIRNLSKYELSKLDDKNIKVIDMKEQFGKSGL